MRSRPGNKSFEQGNMALRVIICMAERPQSWNVPMKKSNSQRLKKSKKFAFRNSPFTKQHNISFNGTKSKIFDRVRRLTTQQHARLVMQCDANNACTVTECHSVKEAFSK